MTPVMVPLISGTTVRRWSALSLEQSVCKSRFGIREKGRTRLDTTWYRDLGSLSDTDRSVQNRFANGETVCGISQYE